MIHLVGVTFKGIVKDRVLQGILFSSVLFLLIPVVSSMSMRQNVELSITLSLSLISFILLLLSVFLGGTAIWKDMERRYTYSVLGLPLTRGQYLVGKFLGIGCFLLLTVLFLGIISCFVVAYTAKGYPPDRAIVWTNVWLAIVAEGCKYLLLTSVAFLFSSISTSFFLPIFGTISVFWVGSFSQEAFEYIRSGASQHLPEFSRLAAEFLYYVLPNFGAFDLKVYAIYGIMPNLSELFYLFFYFVIYLSLTLLVAATVFKKREMR